MVRSGSIILLLLGLLSPGYAGDVIDYVRLNRVGQTAEDQEMFSNYFKTLNRELPPPYPVLLIFTEIKEGDTPVPAFAYTRFIPSYVASDGKLLINGKIIIVIDSRQCVGSQIESLVHEWAHVISLPDDATHGEVWGKNYSKVFRCIAEKEKFSGKKVHNETKGKKDPVETGRRSNILVP